jgi:aryl sulfotransferase
MSTGVVAGQTDGTPAPSFFDTEIGYWAERRRGNFLLVHYNDLAEDREAEMRRIAGFLEIEIEETAWPALVRAAGFEEMRAAGDALAPFTTVLFAEGSRRFFNKGTNGRWRDVLTERDLALYDAKIRAKFTPGLAAWLEGGRRTAGDPRESAD